MKLVFFRLFALVAFLFVSGVLTPATAQAPAWQAAMALATNAGVGATAADSSGNLYVAGAFSGTLTLGATTLSAPGGSYNVFVAKWHRASSTWLWAQQSVGTGIAAPSTLAIKGHNVYVAGYLENTTMRFDAVALTSAGSDDMFVAKLTDRGTTAAWAWAQQAGGLNADQIVGLAVAGSQVYIAGSASGTVQFGAISLTGGGEAFVAKLTDAGVTSNWTWAQRGDGQLNALTAQGQELYVSGSFRNTARFGGITLPSSAGGVDVFVAKLTDAGTTSTWTWAQRGGGAGDDQGNAVAVSGGSVYVAGSIRSSSCAFGTSTLPALSGSEDVFVAKLTDAGATADWTWAQGVGGPSTESAFALAANGPMVYVAGYLNSAVVRFGVHTVVTQAGGMFVARLTDAGTTSSWTWAQTATSPSFESGRIVTVNGPHVYVVGQFSGATADFSGIQLTNPATPLSATFLAYLEDSPLGLAAGIDAPAVSLYPNPAREAVRLTGATPRAPLTLFDAVGLVVLTGATDAAGAATMDVRGLPGGLYVVRAGAVTRRLVVR